MGSQTAGTLTQVSHSIRVQRQRSQAEDPSFSCPGELFRK